MSTDSASTEKSNFLPGIRSAVIDSRSPGPTGYSVGWNKPTLVIETSRPASSVPQYNSTSAKSMSVSVEMLVSSPLIRVPSEPAEPSCSISLEFGVSPEIAYIRCNQVSVVPRGAIKGVVPSDVEIGDNPVGIQVASADHNRNVVQRTPFARVQRPYYGMGAYADQSLLSTRVVREGHPGLDGLAHVLRYKGIFRAGRSGYFGIGGSVVPYPLVAETGPAEAVRVGDGMSPSCQRLALAGMVGYPYTAGGGTVGDVAKPHLSRSWSASLRNPRHR